jgi:5'-phosphate synthase pdxT subunit
MGRIVTVRQARLLATSFHPEITGDPRFHELFVDMVRGAATGTDLETPTGPPYRR